MANRDSPAGLQASDFTDQRNDALREGVKGLFIMNGGGAVALLAFLQAIWNDSNHLANYVVASIAIHAVGVSLAGVVQFFRYHASFNFQARKVTAFHVFRSLYLTASYVSLIL